MLAEKGYRLSFAVLMLGALGVSGCGGGSARLGSGAAGDAARPVQLGRGTPAGGGQPSVLQPANEVEVRKAIAIYRINKKRGNGPVQIAGADLNEDGTPEAIVLFAGKDWCTSIGCSLAVFQPGQHGYRVVSRTVRVKAPVVVGHAQTNGWRDLYVATGGAGTAPLRRVRLTFTGNGYSRNAMLEDEIPPDVPQPGEVAIRQAPQAPVQNTGASRASNP